VLQPPVEAQLEQAEPTVFVSPELLFDLTPKVENFRFTSEL